LAQHEQLIDNDPEKYRPEKCPYPDCGRKGLWLHGHYERTVREKTKRDSEHEQAQGTKIRVARYRCPHCKHTCSSLPSCVAPRRWYIWKVQEAVLALLLKGGALNDCARQFLPSRRTARRWLRWLGQKHNGFALHLRERWADLGRTTVMEELWQMCLSKEPLSEVMEYLARRGADIT
jgi:transposase-like protein